MQKIDDDSFKGVSKISVLATLFVPLIPFFLAKGNIGIALIYLMFVPILLGIGAVLNFSIT